MDHSKTITRFTIINTEGKSLSINLTWKDLKQLKENFLKIKIPEEYV